MKILIVYNSEKPNAFETAEKCSKLLCDFGAMTKISVFDTHKNNEIPCAGFDAVIAVGGDGTMLKVAKCAAAEDVPILGVNAGRIGYLAGVDLDDLDELKHLAEGDFFAENRLMINASIIRDGKMIAAYNCLNDAVISKCTVANMIDISLIIGNNSIGYRSDGFIVATPTGSTAYSMSAGGPVVDPTLSCMVLTPVCPHTFMNRSTVINADSTIDIKVGGEMGSAYFTADGREGFELKKGDLVRIKRSDKYARFINIGNQTVYKVFSEKNRINDPVAAKG